MARRYGYKVPAEEALAHPWRDGDAEGEAEGRVEGKAEGKAEGTSEEKVEAVEGRSLIGVVFGFTRFGQWCYRLTR